MLTGKLGPCMAPNALKVADNNYWPAANKLVVACTYYLMMTFTCQPFSHLRDPELASTVTLLVENELSNFKMQTLDNMKE